MSDVSKFLVYAHRGGAGLYPESTIPAFENAVKLGVDVLEMDVGMTKNGYVVVSHDRALHPDITRFNGQWIGDQKILVKDLNYSDLRNYDVGRAQPGSAYEKSHPATRWLDDVHRPMLEDVFKHVNQLPGGDKMRFQIEIKTLASAEDETWSPHEIARALVAIISKAGVARRVELNAIDWRSMEYINEMNPEITVGYLPNYDWYYKYKDNKATIIDLTNDIAARGGKFQSIKNDYYSLDNDEARKQIDHAKSLNIKTYIWGMEGAMDKPENMQRFIELGVDGIITDRPDILKQVLADYKK